MHFETGDVKVRMRTGNYLHGNLSLTTRKMRVCPGSEIMISPGGAKVLPASRIQMVHDLAELSEPTGWFTSGFSRI